MRKTEMEKYKVTKSIDTFGVLDKRIYVGDVEKTINIFTKKEFWLESKETWDVYALLMREVSGAIVIHASPMPSEIMELFSNSFNGAPKELPNELPHMSVI